MSNSAEIHLREAFSGWGEGALEIRALDGYPLFDLDPFYRQQKALNAFFQELSKHGSFLGSLDVTKTDVGQQLLESSGEEQRTLIKAMFVRLTWLHQQPAVMTLPLYNLLNRFWRRNLGLEQHELQLLLRWTSLHIRSYKFDVVGLLKQVDYLSKREALSVALLEQVQGLESVSFVRAMRPDRLKAIKAKIKELSQPQQQQEFEFDEGDEWGVSMNHWTREQKQSALWMKLFGIMHKAPAKPNKSFLKKGTAIIDLLGEAVFLEGGATAIQGLLKLRILDRPFMDEFQYTWSKQHLIAPENGKTARGVLLLLGGYAQEQQLLLMAEIGVKAFRKVPGVGPASALLGNAVVQALSSSNQLSAATALLRMRQGVKLPAARKKIQTALQHWADINGQSMHLLEDLAVPHFELQDGKTVMQFSTEYSVEAVFDRRGKLKVSWSKAGEPLKTMPKAVGDQFPQKLKDWKARMSALRKQYSLQRYRLEASYQHQLTLPVHRFREYYLEHPLMSILVSRCVWWLTFSDRKVLGIWRDGTFVDHRNHPIVDWSEVEYFQLWHPVHSDADEVLSWRLYTELEDVVQPFKQAYREKYLLTEAEVATSTYSNRMAAHLMKQKQFHALTRERGWNYVMAGNFDRSWEAKATLQLPQEYAAELWLTEVKEEERSGVWTYVSTDQVRFTLNGEQIPLEEVPSILFSEVMRDVDLFVGVCSVGNDPYWRDQGGMPNYRDYWEDYAFGELTQVAQTRRQLLERLIPRLKIAKKCTLTDRYLVVKGQLRTYKIHIGSGNILMEPDDEYLCIVPDHSRAKVEAYLPFEGDSGLSLVLSKAFLLAEDQKIKDEIILRQLQRS